MRIDPDSIRAFYGRAPKRRVPQLTHPLSSFTFVNGAVGLGDSVMLASILGHQTPDMPLSVWSHGPYLEPLRPMFPPQQGSMQPFLVDIDRLKFCFDIGNGHFLQRLERLLGGRPDPLPRARMKSLEGGKIDRAVVVHLEPGAQAAWQRRWIKPNARLLSESSRAALQHFISTESAYRFFEIGSAPSGIDGVGDWTGLSLIETIERMSRCEYFVGIMSGPIHLAAALDLRMIAIVDFPDPDRIWLPTLADIDQVESEWFYPQSVLLHQEGAGGTVEVLSARNLSRALRGEVYPYWSRDYLEMIFESPGPG
jgi:hypothetical protein